MQSQIIDGSITLKLILEEDTVRAGLEGWLAMRKNGGFSYIVSIILYKFHYS
jgi:hypothetical protein